MKFKKLFILLCASLMLTVSCSKTSEPSGKYFNVSFVEKVGYTIEGNKVVKEGDDYFFKVVANPFYDISNIVVTANGESCNRISENEFVINDVNENIIIDVSGVKPEANITLNNSSYYFELGKVPGIAKNKSYYLEGVSAKYLGYSVYVDVDISSVDFNKEGMYTIDYLIVDHPEIKNHASIIIYTLNEIEDVTIDIGYTKTMFVSGKYGEAFLDFEIVDENNYVLTNNDIQFDSNEKFNYLTNNYINKLNIGEHVFTFKAPYEKTATRSFTLNLIDEMDLQISFTNNNSSIAFYKNAVNLPDVKINENNCQKISIKYFLGDVEYKNSLECAKQIVDYDKDYLYEIKTFKNDVEYSKKYKISLVIDGTQYFSFKNNCDGSGDGKGGFANISLSENGHYVMDINNNGSGDTNLYFNDNFLKKHNTEDKDYIFVIFKILQFSKSGLNPSIWYIDAEKCRDIDNPKDAVGRVDYNSAGELKKGSMFALKLKINKTDDAVRETMSNNLIFRDLAGRFEIVKTMFRNYDEIIPYNDALYSDIGSFSEYIELDQYEDADFSNKESFFVKSSGSYIKFKADKLFTEMQNDNKKYLTFDIEISSNVKNKEVLSIYGAHGGGALDISSSISLNHEGKGKVVVNLKEHYFDINQQFKLGLTLYGSTMTKYNEFKTPSGLEYNLQQFLESPYYVVDCCFRISNFQFLNSI